MYKRQLDGTVPWHLVWRMHSLNDLGLSRNAMSGTLPHWLGGFDALARLRLDENSLSGTLPTWLGSFTQLSELGLHGNRLSGSIPTEIAAASRLSYLYLQDNNYQLTGRISDIPSEFSYEKQPQLRVLCVPHPGSGDTQCWKG